MLHSVRRVIQATRSGLRRYPTALLDSTLHAAGLVRTHGHTQRHQHDHFHRMMHGPLAASWLGHGSVLLRHAGKTVLVDPVFSDRIGVSLAGRTIGLGRFDPLPFDPAHLPRVDLVLITHAHFDHLDRPTLRALANPTTTLITARRTAGLIPQGFGEVRELDWNQSVRLDDLHIAAIRPRHWGARTAIDRARGYNSYLLRDPEGRGVLLAGDTAHTDAFDRLGDLDLAVLGIGSYEPWAHAHATPEEAWSMFRSMGARRLLPVHHSTFPLGDEPRHEPIQRLRAASNGLHASIIELPPGRVWPSDAA